jgi:hypothetical protein
VTYISAMPKRTPRIKLFEWRITRIRATPARLIGYVQAADAEQAVKEAIARYGIDNPQEQARLAAQRVKEIG